MRGFPTFLFLLATAYLVPGPDFAFIVASAARGPRLGRAAAGGVVTGLVVHAVLAAAGVSSLLATTSWGLGALRIVGAGFLVWVGIATILAAVGTPVHEDGEALSTGRAAAAHSGPAGAPPTAPAAWRRGLLGNLLNPKTLLFFMALIPQFVDPARRVLPQVAVLSAITVLAGVAWWSFVVRTAGRLVPLLAEARVRRRVDLVTGIALLTLAGLVAVL